ncbi:hypothetical protein L484_013103 [Morus notabilis]|uniref:Uncharacterized protein n=1 Tax=Morus notabilis TaxID=981085 RepID=W9R1Y0_9ROSA|nr:hypothetical protein L484_013103 [Morus notabilis]
MKKSIVLYGAPSFHHMVSMLELGKLILQHHPYLSITILVTALPLAVDTTTTSSYIDQLSPSPSSLFPPLIFPNP